MFSPLLNFRANLEYIGEYSLRFLKTSTTNGFPYIKRDFCLVGRAAQIVSEQSFCAELSAQ